MYTRTLNRVSLLGKLILEPELYHAPSGKAYCRMRLLTSYTYLDLAGNEITNRQTHHITAWGRQAEISAEYLHVNSLIFVEGHLEYPEWTAKDGTLKKKTEIHVHQLLMLSPTRRLIRTKDAADPNAQTIETTDPDALYTPTPADDLPNTQED